MLYPNAWKHSTERCTWEFILPDTQVEYYDYYPESNRFTFLIDFVRNDTTEISDVVLTVELSGGQTVTFPAHFDSSKQCWVTSFKLGGVLFETPPVHVGVTYTVREPNIRVDVRQYNDISQQLDSLARLNNQLETLVSSATEANIDQKMAEYEALVGYGLLNNQLQEEDAQWLLWFNTLSAEEMAQEANALMDEMQSLNDELEELTRKSMEQPDLSPYGTYHLGDSITMTITDCSAYSKSTILAQGFHEQELTDGSVAYFLDEGQRSVLVSFELGFALEMRYEVPMNGAMRVSVFDICEQGINFLKDVCLDRLKNAVENANDQILSVLAKLNEKRDALARYIGRLEAVINNPNAGLVDRTKARALAFASKQVLMHSDKAVKVVLKGLSLVKRLVPFASYVSMIYDFIKHFNVYKTLFRKVPVPCEDDEPAAENCREMVVSAAKVTLAYVTGKFVIQLASDIAMLGEVAAAPETMGASLALTIPTYLLKQAAAFAADLAFKKNDDQQIAAIEKAISLLKCVNDDDEDPKPDDPGEIDRPRRPFRRPITPRKRPLIDPSGFVCEAVESNRLEGVTATCLYKKEVEDMYGEKHQEVTVWDAENYGQQNPLLTDRQGMYSWMVPTGEWQVRYEKEGFDTQYSAWLPVPPPQLDVNVAMVRRAQPAIDQAQAYERAIDLGFTLYMKERFLNGATITFWQDGQQLDGQLTAIDAETAFGQDSEDGEQLISALRFVPKKALAVGSQVTVKVSALVRSYADVAMGQDAELTLTVNRQVASISAGGTISVPYGGTRQVVLTARPAQAAAYARVTMESISPEIARLETGAVTLDAEGHAYITVSGLLPGTTYLVYNIDGTDLQAMDTVVVSSQTDYIAPPRASLISGTYVGEGTRVSLSADEGCTIWYTLDGSCPCDSQKRQRYTEPITISANTTLKAMAITADGSESEVVTFVWFIDTAIGTPASTVLPAVSGIWNLKGVRQPRPVRGISIVNGRKVTGK